MRRYIPLILSFVWGLGPITAQETVSELFEERSRTVVYIEYYIQHEIDRQGVQGVGMVVSEEGLVATLQNVFPEWVPVDQFRDIRLFPAGNPTGEGFLATYLGMDAVSGWHFLQLEEVETAMEYLTPITEFSSGTPQIGDGLWGVCMTSQELNYIPYFRDGRLSTSQLLPLMTGFSTHELAVPGGPVFMEDGRSAGRAGQALPRERDMWIGKDYFRANVRHPDESFVFMHADPFFEELERILEGRTYEQRQAWIGVVGTQPLDKDTARFLGLANQGAIVVSEILPDSPAEAAGLIDRDLLVRINGEKIPQLKPDSVIQSFFERQITLAGPGGELAFTVLRGDEESEITLTTREVPKLMREAQRKYFDGVGLTVRELVINDSIQRRRDYREAQGAMVSFIKNNSAAASGSLRVGDWILEIGGRIIEDFEQAVEELEKQIADTESEEIVFLVRRMTETSVVRVRKN